jgi:putative ABC transport system permease protein
MRSLIRRPGFTLVALLILATGIGATTAVFSVVQHVLLAPLPYHEPDRAVMIWSRWRGFDKTWVSDQEVRDYQSRVSSLADVAAWDGSQANLTGAGDPVRVGASFVTANLFSVLGVQPVVGRAFTEADAQPDTSTVAIISYSLWRRQFDGGDVVGRTVQINGIAREIVGVMPRAFRMPTDYVVNAEEPTDLWLPNRLDTSADSRGSHGLYAVARLRPDATVARVNEELASVTRQLTQEGAYPEAMHFSAFAVTTTDEAVALVRPALRLVFGAVACLLLIGCANVATLMLVRGEGRAREMAVRSAMGADPARLARQLLGETAALAAVAAVVGLALAWALLRLVTAVPQAILPRGTDAIGMSWSMVWFAAALSMVTLLLVALVPAWRASRVDLVDALKDGAPSTSAGVHRRRLRGLLVATAIGLAVLLVTGTGLMLRTLWNLERIDLGFDPDRVLTMRLALPQAQYDTPEKVVGFYDRLGTRVRSLSGVERAGLIRLLPLATQIGDWGLAVEGYVPPPGIGSPGDWQIASAGGPEALGERLVAGRWFTDKDTMGAPDVALINEAMARKYWPGREALGGRFRQGGPTRAWITVVGIVGNVRHNGVTAEIKPKFYRPVGQWHQTSGTPARNMTLVVKTAGDPLKMAHAVRSEIRAIDPNLPVAAIQSMQDVVDASTATPRLTGTLLASFAGVALALAAMGIYGLLSYVVAQRRRELGIRMAIGAGRGRVARLVVNQGLFYAGVGAAAGVVVAAIASRFLASLLYGVDPIDPATLALGPIVLVGVAIAASLIPAWRATRIDPVKTLRAE